MDKQEIPETTTKIEPKKKLEYSQNLNQRNRSKNQLFNRRITGIWISSCGGGGGGGGDGDGHENDIDNDGDYDDGGNRSSYDIKLTTKHTFTHEIIKNHG